MLRANAIMDVERLTTKQFELFQKFIYERSGIKIEISKVTLVSNRIRRRLNAATHPDFDSYYHFLTSKAGEHEVEGFLDAITTNETSFFRTMTNFEWFKNDYIKEILKEKTEGKRPPTLRVWSAACSSGEEPYSIAMCLAELSIPLRGWEIDILGTDISETTLKLARKGIYRTRTMQSLDEAKIRRYFSEDSHDQFKLRPAIAEMVRFKKHNLMQPSHEPPFDCIWLRNVLIYFDRESKAKVIDNLVRSLARGGYLVVGPSEGVYDMLGMLQKRGTFLYQKP